MPNLKRLVQNGVLICSALIFTTPAYGQGLSWDFIKNYYKPLLAGAATTVVAHELGHVAVASAHGVSSTFNNFTVTYPEADNLDDDTKLRISSAGYQVQWLVSEWGFYQLGKSGLSNQKIAYNSGLVLGHIAISTAYLTVLKGHEDGDSLGVSSSSGLSERSVLFSLAVPAILDSVRLFSDNPPRWLPMLSKGSKAVGIAAVWSF